ncbi:hypothetical protein CH92_05480 [Stutzerimonas stutzeri]|uniref:Uncharacterized protein n=1 Tax=Stutzerimonas stutzeri TaxID=316 RepID=W8RGH7_STUST|nr:hypothetical protein CH92_05480 [Stutzerimonas stutzeri]
MAIIEVAPLMHRIIASIADQGRPPKVLRLVATPAVRLLKSLPTLIVPTLPLMNFIPAPGTPAPRIRPSVPIVILLRKLPLIARRQILRILPVVRVRTARVVLVRAAFDMITAAVRLVEPHATPRICTGLGAEPQPEQ